MEATGGPERRDPSIKKSGGRRARRARCKVTGARNRRSQRSSAADR